MIPFIDLKAQFRALEPRIRAGIDRVLEHGQFIMGPEVGELEERLAEYVGVKHCVAASSGTDTLLIAMMALEIGSGDEVITTPFSFIATAEMIALLGATPVFVDIDPGTYNIDAAKIEAAIGPRTRAIMPVSLYGQCADMDAINAIAQKHGLPVIEDAAQSFGANYKGRRSCGLSTIGSTSFFPTKPLEDTATAVRYLPMTMDSPRRCAKSASMDRTAVIIIRGSASTVASIRCRRPCFSPSSSASTGKSSSARKSLPDTRRRSTKAAPVW